MPTTEQDLSHNFVESTNEFGEYDRVIYCPQCGRVAWHFNYTNKSAEELQKAIPQPCPGKFTVMESQKTQLTGGK